jgi:Mn2+/Fe2+ NRAMP family transporter
MATEQATRRRFVDKLKDLGPGFVVAAAFLGPGTITTAVIVRPDLAALAGGFVPHMPSGGLLTVVALVGTTVVPYNLFLHASSVKEKWDPEVGTDHALSAARTLSGG